MAALADVDLLIYIEYLHKSYIRFIVGLGYNWLIFQMTEIN